MTTKPTMSRSRPLRSFTSYHVRSSASVDGKRIPYHALGGTRRRIRGMAAKTRTSPLRTRANVTPALLDSARHARLRRSGAPQHPPVQPHDRANEADHAEPRTQRKILGHERNRRVLRESNDEPGVYHSPNALADDQSRRHQRSQ